MFAGVVSMVAREDDNGIVGESKLVERVDDLSNLGVHEADTRVVRLKTLPTLVIGHFVLFLFVTSKTCRWNVGLVLFNISNDTHFFFGVPAKVGFLGCNVRRMWTKETNR